MSVMKQRQSREGVLTNQPTEKFIFLRDLLPPNPRPRMIDSVSFGAREQPLITTFGGKDIVFIMRPNIDVINGVNNCFNF